MSGVTPIPDAAARDAALDPSRSFIVQAPAGSGKTELLIQRYLRLLAVVDEPEEVLAVTFTRKAAGEMRTRVIAALTLAERDTPPGEPHSRRSWELARSVIQDERKRAWQLQRHPARLSISTLDAVNAWLAGRSPLCAGGSAVRSVTDTPELFYEEAARSTLEHLGRKGGASGHLAIVLRHLDNDTSRFVRLIVAMLPRRDQWLRQVFAAHGDRAAMEQPIRELAEQALGRAASCLDDGLRSELMALLSFAGVNLRVSGRDSSLQLWADRNVFPAAQLAELSAWQALADALLTAGDGDWRRKVDVRMGFPPRSQEKTRMEQLLADCARRADLHEVLLEVRAIPGAGYSDGQWVVLEALVEVLKLAAGELRLVFVARGATDFPEIAADALAALGSPDEPTELGLALDHRVQHVLVDEFQDTSLSQFELLQQLTAGWSPDDGRTLFLVGDPMQSIYRFREAEVGLFMKVRDQGLGDIRPVFLQLRCNFRSEPPLVDWINNVFPHVFPRRDDSLRGNVRFASSLSVREPTGSGSEVKLHWLPAGTGSLEARRIVDLVEESMRRSPQEQICILVRSRSHARQVIPALRSAGIAFVAPEIENLEYSSVAQDLLALTRALLQPADRLAWIGVLRAPWCALSLADLSALLGGDRQSAVSELLRERDSVSPAVSETGRPAVDRLLTVIERANHSRGRRSLRDLVEGVWLDLAGPATIRDEAEMESAESFLSILELLDAGGDCGDVLALEQQMKRRRGSLGSGDPGLQVMTMHKAKGLEFDTVILPGLARIPRASESPLLAWQDVVTGTGRSAAVLAPIGATGAEQDRLYQYLMRLERDKQIAEAARLLYVACTRARKRLHLIAQVQLLPQPASGRGTIRRPTAGSLLEQLWPALAEDAERNTGAFPPTTMAPEKMPVWTQPPIRRLPLDWNRPPMPDGLPVQATISPASPGGVTYEWASRWAMCAGSVVHQWLKVIAEKGVQRFDKTRLDGLRPAFRAQLANLGTTGQDLERATERVAGALKMAISDARGVWILSSSHDHAECELPVTMFDGSRWRNLVIDRTFVAADGCRWLIDYKTATHEGGDLEGFLLLESTRHLEQLRAYRDALAAIWDEPIRAALYFPLLRRFLEVDLGSVSRQ